MDKEKVSKLLSDPIYCEDLRKSFSENASERVIRFIVDGVPEAYARERSTSRGKHFYNPKGGKMVDFRNKALHALTRDDYMFLKDLRENCEDYTISISVKFRIPIQKGSSNKNAAAKCMNLIKPNSRPDLDNYLKFMLDSLHDVLYADDSYVTEIIGEKAYAFEGKTEITATVRYIKGKE